MYALLLLLAALASAQTAKTVQPAVDKVWKEIDEIQTKALDVEAKHWIREAIASDGETAGFGLAHRRLFMQSAEEDPEAIMSVGVRRELGRRLDAAEDRLGLTSKDQPALENLMARSQEFEAKRAQGVPAEKAAAELEPGERLLDLMARKEFIAHVTSRKPVEEWEMSIDESDEWSARTKAAFRVRVLELAAKYVPTKDEEVRRSEARIAVLTRLFKAPRPFPAAFTQVPKIDLE